MGQVTFVAHTTYQREVRRVGAMVADVAKLLTPECEAGTGWFVAGSLVPIIAYIYEGKSLV